MEKYDAKNLLECYIIDGGGQKVDQFASSGMPIPYRVEVNDWAYKSGVASSSHYTGHLWASSLERLRELAEEWTNSPVELVASED